jgi:hypothetical protein
MDKALHLKDYKKLSDISHSMRSSISAVGLAALRHPLLTLEAMAKSGDNHQNIAQQFELVQAINQTAIEELKASLIV